ncbi:MAG TPA: type IV pilus secretin PilQ [Holophagaceae bacterium]|nr:type IV pilus secretin PilQ [Holophagaceae bacterium]
MTLESNDASRAVIRLTIPGLGSDPSVQVLNHPDRVVVDLSGVDRGRNVGRADLQGLQHPLVSKVRMAQFAAAPKAVTRFVLEVAPGTKVAVARDGQGISLALTQSEGRVEASLSPVAAPAAPVQTPAPAPVVMAKAEPAAAPAPVVPATPLSPLPSIGTGFQALPQLSAASAVVTAEPTAAQAQPAGQQTRGSGRLLGEASSRYTGSKISIDLTNTDLQVFLRYLAEVGHLNLVADQDVQGTYTFKFTDTPWDQVLDIVLKNANLGKEIQNGVLRVAKVDKLQKEADDRKKLEDSKALSGDLETITRPLSYAKSADVAKLTKDLLSKRGSVIVDERTNLLIITDLPKYLKTVDDLIQTLDVQIQQVVIEARVVEANKDWQRAFGVRWPTSNSGDVNLSIIPAGGGQAQDAVWGTFGQAPSWNSTGGFNRPPSGQALGLNYEGGKSGVTSLAAPAGEFWLSFLSNRLSVNFILQALEKDGVIKIVSSPKVVTQNNKKASILSGEKIPYPTQQGGAAGGAITVSFVEANLKLEVTPQITSEGTIIMDVNVEKAEADFSRTVNGTPTILRKALDTQVLVRDGGTAILGGVYITKTDKENVGVPFLKNIPILGALFRTKSNAESNAELLIFITPRILRQ